MTEPNPFTIDREIADAERKLNELKDQKSYLEGLTLEQRLATLIHELQCGFNHIDQCGWEYENWTDKLRPNGTRVRYVRKAEALLAEYSMSEDEAMHFLLVTRKLRNLI